MLFGVGGHDVDYFKGVVQHNFDVVNAGAVTLESAGLLRTLIRLPSRDLSAVYSDQFPIKFGLHCFFSGLIDHHELLIAVSL